MRVNKKTISLLIVMALISLSVAGSATFALSSRKEQNIISSKTLEVVRLWDEGKEEVVEYLLTTEVRVNDAKLKEVSRKFAETLPQFIALDIPLAGWYVDVFSGTFHVGLTDLKENYIKPIKAIVEKVEGGG
ncbi:MAG: hypothetical protein DDT42_01741 [candidate division WS2 bacterium]|uniref:Uncharacterized protein n=1 Tax=Psychracetigena formicireducens TaxID=2986056 RepID=A0A9E2BIP8_PSYF1|nr:hypothetical protein [Candidatus Psychracetigena formicireducens]